MTSLIKQKLIPTSRIEQNQAYLLDDATLSSGTVLLVFTFRTVGLAATFVLTFVVVGFFTAPCEIVVDFGCG